MSTTTTTPIGSPEKHRARHCTTFHLRRLGIKITLCHSTEASVFRHTDDCMFERANGEIRASACLYSLLQQISDDPGYKLAHELSDMFGPDWDNAAQHHWNRRCCRGRMLSGDMS